MALSAAGIGSNLDVNGIVTQLMQLEQQPLVALSKRDAALNAQLSAIGSIKGALSAFQNAAKTLKTAAENSGFKVTSSDSGAISGSATASAGAGSYRVSVTQLARAQGLVAAGQASASAAIGDGTATTLTFTFGEISGGSLDADTGTYSGATFVPDSEREARTLTIDGSNNSLQGIRDAINAAGIGVTAAIVNDGSGSAQRLTLVADQTGAKSSLKIAVSGNADIANMLTYDPAGTQKLSQTQAALDAKLTVNGIAVTRPGNTIDGAIQGVTLNVSKVAADVTISAARDASSIRSALDGLVKTYNDVNRSIASVTGYKAMMQGDSAVIGIQSRLRAAIGQVLGGNSVTSLSQLGVSFQLDGSLSFDSNKLQSAIGSDLSGVVSAARTFGTSLSSLAESLLGSNGAVQARTDGITRSLADIANRRDAITARLDSIEKRYRAQFAALDAMLGSMLQTSNYLQQQLNNLPKIQN